MSKIIMHIDVNSAFLSWTAKNRLDKGESLDIRQVPSIIGGDEKSRHGIVLAKSMPAKKFGIKTGESLFSARQKCPEILIFPPEMELYRKCSNMLYNLICDYSPVVERYSIDECFLDYTGCERLLGEPVQVANQIKDRVKNELGFTVNIGVGMNKFTAKQAGDLEKPNKIHAVLSIDQVIEKLWPIPVHDMYMCGRKTADKFHSFGIHTIGDLAQFDINLLQKTLKSAGVMLHCYANGIDYSKIVMTDSVPQKSFSNSVTLPIDIINSKQAKSVLLSLADKVCNRMRQDGFCAGIISLFIKDNEFQTQNFAIRLYSYSAVTRDIYHRLCELFDTNWSGVPIRLLGVGAYELIPEYTRACTLIDEDQYNKLRSLDNTVDHLRIKFGNKAVFFAGMWK